MSQPIIVIEGVDATGKTTQFNKISEYIKEKTNGNCYVGSFPNYSSLSSGPLRMYLNGDIKNKMHYMQHASLYAVDRVVTFKNEWEDVYNYTGDDIRPIILSRYTSSNMVYSAFHATTPYPIRAMDEVDRLEHGILGLPRPCSVIVLNPPDINIILRRIRQRSSNLDINESNDELIIETANLYKIAADRYDWSVVDISDPTTGYEYTEDELFTKIKTIVDDDLYRFKKLHFNKR